MASVFVCPQCGKKYMIDAMVLHTVQTCQCGQRIVVSPDAASASSEALTSTPVQSPLPQTDVDIAVAAIYGDLKADAQDSNPTNPAPELSSEVDAPGLPRRPSPDEPAHSPNMAGPPPRRPDGSPASGRADRLLDGPEKTESGFRTDVDRGARENPYAPPSQDK